MQNYNDVCKTESSVWFEIKPNEGEEFLKWAKSLGCVWTTGQDIAPTRNTGFFHFSIGCDGKLANVSMHAWVAEQFKNIPRYSFSKCVTDGFFKK